MQTRVAILDERENLKRPFYGSVILHFALVASLLLGNWLQSRRSRLNWGDIHGGGAGSVAVNVVQRIPLPTESGPVNPVASDTESRIPERQAKTPAKAARAPLKDLNAIPLSTRDALKKAPRESATVNKFREAQKDQPNQMYSQAGQKLVSPDMVGVAGGGGGGVSLGNNSPFGTMCGPYADRVKNMVAMNWKTGELDAGIRSANPVVVTFTIPKDGATPSNSVRVRQSSGNPAVDMSAQRAILQAAPFPPLPQQCGGSSVDVEFWFTLRR